MEPQQQPSHLHEPAEHADVVPINGDSSRKKIVKWTVQEFAAVGREAAKELLKMGIGIIPNERDRQGTRLLLDCIAQAQAIALTDRMRRRLGVNARGAYNDLLYEFMGRALTDIQAERSREKQVAALALPPTPAPPLAVAPAPPPKVEAVASPFEEMIDQRILKYFHPLENSVTETLVEMSEEIKALKVEITRLKAPSNFNIPIKYPTCTIGGCRKDQFDFIVKAAKEKGLEVSLRHLDQDQSQVRITTEYCVFMRFVGHVQWDQAQNSGLPPERIAFITGGTEKVIMQLSVWFKR